MEGFLERTVQQLLAVHVTVHSTRLPNMDVESTLHHGHVLDLQGLSGVLASTFSPGLLFGLCCVLLPWLRHERRVMLLLSGRQAVV